MERKLIFCVVQVIFCLSSCNSISKKQEKTETYRSLSAINPTPSSGADFVVTNRVSRVVLFRDKKPVCSFSAVKHSRRIPSYFQPVSDNVHFSLPECDQKDLGIAHRISQNAVFLDENGRYQTAALPVLAVPVAFCLAGGALGAYIASKRVEKQRSYDEKMNDMFVSTLGMPISMIVMSSGYKGVFGKFNIAGRFGVAGVCAGMSAVMVFFYE
ncbi:MAG: hypothetical protein OXJ52_05445 [Oligoflexia bacterium]|nr:hypothetical protein [Oligoflexia bacterium]